jgi:putative transposase
MPRSLQAPRWPLAAALVTASGHFGYRLPGIRGLGLAAAEDGASWTALLRSLKARGLAGVQLVIADAHLGLRQAVAAVMAGAAIQRCRVHVLRNVLALVPRGVGELGRQFPRLETMLGDAAEDLLAFTSFRPSH